MPAVERFNVLGIGLSVINMELALSTLEYWIEEKKSRYVCVAPVYTVMQGFYDPGLRRILNGADLVTPDGMPLVWMSHLLGHKSVTRVYGPDLLLALCHLSQEKNYRHCFYGGAGGVPQRLALSLQRRFPELKIVGSFSPPFRSLTPEEDRDFVRRINASGADVVWVGLGSPKQDHWMAEHVGRIDAPLMIGVGAAFDFISGRVKQAPRWMQRGGIEWVFRLLQEPRRLWRRYLIYNPLFVYHAVLQLTGVKQYPAS